MVKKLKAKYYQAVRKTTKKIERTQSVPFSEFDKVNFDYFESDIPLANGGTLDKGKYTPPIKTMTIPQEVQGLIDLDANGISDINLKAVVEFLQERFT